MNCIFIDLGRQYGGAEQYLFSIIKKWKESGNSFKIVAKNNTYFIKKAIDCFNEDSVIGVNYSLKDLKNLKRILSEYKTDVISINGINSGFYINLLHSNVPKVTTVHSNAYMDRSDKNILIRRIFVIVENYLLKKSYKIIVVSKALKNLLLERGISENKIVYIPNGVNQIYYNEKKYRESPNDVLKICYVGRLEKVKGCETLVNALSELHNENFVCDIYGEGSLRDNLVALVNKYSLDKKINFKGFNSNIREVLDQYDVEIVPSEYEGFPLIIPEAMNARCFLICSNVGGIPYIINDGINGYLFEKNNVKELSEKIKDVLVKPDITIKMVEQAYNDFINNYTAEKMANNTVSLLKTAKINMDNDHL